MGKYLTKKEFKEQFEELIDMYDERPTKGALKAMWNEQIGIHKVANLISEHQEETWINPYY